MTTARAGHTATFMPDKKVMIAGGQNDHEVVLATTEVYDPTKETFSPGEKMFTAREGHVATAIGDRHIIITGGSTRSGVALSSTEDFDFDTGKFERESPCTRAAPGPPAF